MSIKTFRYLPLVLGACALVSCTKNPGVEAPLDGSAIELSVGVADPVPATKSVVTDGTSKTLGTFASLTRVFFLMKADDASSEHRPTKTAMTYGDVAAAQSKVTFTDDVDGGFHMYWDDAYARDTKLSVYGLAINGKKRGNFDIGESGGTTYNYGGGSWDGTIHRTFPWATSSVPEYKTVWNIGDKSNSYSTQSKESFDWQDLCFSNNLADNGVGKDKRLYFDSSSKKFTGDQMIFYHALSKITIEIWAGEGFTATPSSSDFKFVPVAGTADNNFALNGFNGAGTFNLITGEFDTPVTPKDYTSICLTSTDRTAKDTKPVYVLNAYLVPGTDLEHTSKDDAMSFVIDNNKYDISMATLYNAIKSQTSNYVLSAGVNYVFKFTVGKTRIEKLTAQIVPWETVTADEIQPKANAVTVTTRTVSSDDHPGDFALYRLPYEYNGATIDMTVKNYDWNGRYTDKASLTQATDYATTHMWNTGWFYESNKTFYHFRTVIPSETAVQDGSTTPEKDDYLVLASNSIVTTPAQTFTDVLWGAPFAAATGAGNKYGYDTAAKGFDGTTSTHQIHHGITTTESSVNFLLFHMMSEVTFNITTTTTADKVKLQDGVKNTTVELIGYYPSGKVLMGNGHVKVTGSKSTPESPVAITMDTYTAEAGAVAAKSVFRYGAVPQDLANVTLRVTTPDNNRYEVAMAGIPAPSVTTTNLAYPYSTTIGYWYPGFKYEYTLRLKKTGIEGITATVLDWETVTAGSQDVQIK